MRNTLKLWVRVISGCDLKTMEGTDILKWKSENSKGLWRSSFSIPLLTPHTLNPSTSFYSISIYWMPIKPDCAYGLTWTVSKQSSVKGANIVWGRQTYKEICCHQCHVGSMDWWPNIKWKEFKEPVMARMNLYQVLNEKTKWGRWSQASCKVGWPTDPMANASMELNGVNYCWLSGSNWRLVWKSG